MALKECKRGEYYALSFLGFNYNYVCKSGGSHDCGTYVDMKDKKFRISRNNETSWRTDIPCKVRPATNLEIIWLRNCIKHNQFLERPSILNIYGLIK